MSRWSAASAGCCCAVRRRARAGKVDRRHVSPEPPRAARKPFPAQQPRQPVRAADALPCRLPQPAPHQCRGLLRGGGRLDVRAVACRSWAVQVTTNRVPLRLAAFVTGFAALNLNYANGLNSCLLGGSPSACRHHITMKSAATRLGKPFLSVGSSICANLTASNPWAARSRSKERSPVLLL